jgi:hypothetical protein
MIQARRDDHAFAQPGASMADGVPRRPARWLGRIAMICAAFGLIAPTTGALLQEGIDVLVILNALRATRA